MPASVRLASALRVSMVSAMNETKPTPPPEPRNRHERRKKLRDSAKWDVSMSMGAMPEQRPPLNSGRPTDARPSYLSADQFAEHRRAGQFVPFKCDSCASIISDESTSVLGSLHKVRDVNDPDGPTKEFLVGPCCDPKLKTHNLWHKNGRLLWDEKKTPEQIAKEVARAREAARVDFAENAPPSTYPTAWFAAVAAMYEAGAHHWLAEPHRSDFTNAVCGYHAARLEGMSCGDAVAKFLARANYCGMSAALLAYERARPQNASTTYVRPARVSLRQVPVDLGIDD